MSQELTNRDQCLPDFSKPGNDGVLPDHFTPWRWGVTYTVHPELLSPTQRGREYRLTVSVLRRVGNAHDPGYADLYNRATTIANGRTARLKCADHNAALHTRIFTHGWFTHANSNLARAFVTMGAVFLKPGDAAPQGQSFPAAADFGVPGGMTPENYTLPAVEGDKRVCELYSEADVRDPAVPGTNVFTLSYGEYLASCRDVDYKLFIERAQELAEFHLSMENTPSDRRKSMTVRREWFCATNPDIAVVHLYIER
jgi:hypothetical protein